MEDYEYEDDFEEEISGGSSRKLSPKRKPPPKANKTKPKEHSPGRGQGASHDRLLSSKDLEIKTLFSKLSETKHQLQEMKKENQMLKRLQIRYEKELTGISRLEGELPTILKKHKEEVRVLRNQIRHTQHNNTDLQRRHNEMSTELWKAHERIKKLDSLVKKRGLPEREELVFQLQDTHELLKERDQKIANLEHSLEITKKTHKQEVKMILSKNRQVTQELEVMREENRLTRWQLRERERLLDVTNIYSQRIQHTNLSPLPMNDNQGTQTTLSHPPFINAILVTKPVVQVAECQTDSSWLMNILSPKHQASTDLESNEEITGTTRGFTHKSPTKVGTSKVGSNPVTMATPPTPVSKPTPPISIPPQVPYITSPLSKTTPPTTHTPQHRTVKPTQTPPPHQQTTHEDIDIPLMDISLQSSPNYEPTTTTSDIKTILFGNQSIKPNYTQPTLESSKDVPIGSHPLGRENIPNTPPSHLLGSDKKKELLEKLFPTQTTTTIATTSITSFENKFSTVHTTTANNPVLTSFENKFPVISTSIITNSNLTSFENRFSVASTTTTSSVTNPITTPLHEATPTQSKEKSDLLTKLFPTKATTDATSDSHDSVTKDTSSTSLLSWPERIENMHRGLPAMASAEDRYGSGKTTGSYGNKRDDHDSGNRRNKREGNYGNKRTETVLESETTKYGRRAGKETKPAGLFSDGLIFGGGLESDTPRQVNPIFGSSSQTYPWEKKVDIGQPEKSTIPMNGLGVATRKMSATEDDIEELVI